MAKMTPQTKDLIKTTLALALPKKRLVIISFLLSLVHVGAALVAPLFIGVAINFAVKAGNVDFSGLYQACIVLLVVYTISSISAYYVAYINNALTQYAIKNIRDKLVAKLHKLPLKQIDSRVKGDFINRVISDVDAIGEGVLQGFTQAFTGVLSIIGITVFMMVLNTYIALMVVLLSPLSMLAALFISRSIQKYFKRQSVVAGDLGGHAEEMISGQRTVIAFNHQQRSLEKFCRINDEYTAHNLKASFYSSLINPSTRFINYIVYVICGVMGLYFGLTVGAISSLLMYSNQYARPFNELSSVFSQLQAALASAQRVNQILELSEEQDTADKQDKTHNADAEELLKPSQHMAKALPQYANNLHTTAQGQTAQTPPHTGEYAQPAVFDGINSQSKARVKGEVEFKNISFSYSPDVPLIKDFCLKVNAGQKVAIVGPTGSGKTTLVNLLMRFYEPDSGSICIDGRDIRELSRKNLRDNFGMVLQETWLSGTTIRQNIAYGKPSATEEEIVQAAKHAHCHDFIMAKKHGYDTPINAHSAGLSEGQKQLISIARVMLADAPMLILDEATSSIDSLTERYIQQAFDYLMRGKTSFVIAHRLSTIVKSDVILVLDNGNIAEQDTHEQLLQKGGAYAALYQSQFAKI